jgi:DNA-binding transcriptional LysR family regulator
VVCLADTGHFGRAAEICHITQPAFSRSIQSVEEEFGLQLFDRGAATVTPTDAGRFMLQGARKLLFDSRCLERDMALYRDRVIGDLAFGVGPHPTDIVVPTLVTELRTQYPAIKVRVEVNNTSHLLDRLRTEKIDFLLSNFGHVDEGDDLTVSRLAKLATSAYVRPGHPLLAVKDLKASMIPAYGFGTISMDEDTRMQLRKGAGVVDDRASRLALECDDIDLLKHIGAITDTVIGCADYAAAPDVQSGRLVRLPLTDVPARHAEVALVFLKGRTLSPVASFAVKRLTQIIGQTLA